MPHLLFSRQSSADGSNFALNPSLIVGICIIGAIFFCVILASVVHLCQRLPASAEAPPDNLFRPYSQEQVERMREVRWLNHSEMWETAKMARMEMGEQFGPRPKFNRRTGIGWGFMVGKDGYMRNMNGDRSGGGEDNWSNQGTGGENRKSMASQIPRYDDEYYGEGDPQQQQYRQQHRDQQQMQTYEELERSDEEGHDDDLITEPFPDLPQIPGTTHRFDQQHHQHQQQWYHHEGPRGHLPMARNEDVEQGQFVNQGPKITLNDENHGITHGEQQYAYGDGYGTGRGIELRDLTAIPHAR